MKKLTNNIRKIKIIGILFFLLFFSLAPLPTKKALAWETWGSIPMGVGIETVKEQLLLFATSALQQASIKLSTQNIYMAVSGGSGGGVGFIVNWQATLNTDPIKEAAKYIESLSSSSTQGRGSSNYEVMDNNSLDPSVMANFEGVGEKGLAQYFQSPRFIDSANAQVSVSVSGGNYSATIANIGMGIASQATSTNKCAITYTSNPANMFADGTFKNFNKFISGNNDPWSYATCMQGVYQEKLDSLKKIAETQATAYGGFKGTASGGNTLYPGSLMLAKVANVENIGNQVIANAKGVQQVITSLVMKMGMDAMQNGIGNIKAQVEKGASNVSNKINSQAQNQVNNFGPGAMFGNSSMPSGLPGLGL